MMIKGIALLSFFVCSVSSWGFVSPNGKFGVDEVPSGLAFTMLHEDGKTTPLLELRCEGAEEFGKCGPVEVTYEMKLGKKRSCKNEYNERHYFLPEGDTLSVRLFNDGVAWKKRGASSIRFLNPSHHWLQNWKDCYEDFFPADGEIREGARYGYPALLEFEEGRFALLTESGITPEDAATSMHSTGGYGFDLVPDGPENGGWQTVIAGSLYDIVESTLVTDNSHPTLMEDASWVMPGVASWVYWAYNHGSNDFEIIKKYVELAATLRLPYVLIDAEWDEMKDGKSIEDAVAYARRKGVRPLIWYNSSVGWVNGAPGPKYRLNTADNLEKEFKWCEDLGITGVKIDFFSGDTNMNLKFMAELLEAAARHRLTVNFHGATLPRGWQRTYPNLVSVEAVYGAEWYNNVPTFTEKAACHNATIPFTRNVVGSMDYTPCAFSDSQHPHITTHAHELALTSLYESGIQHIADRPESILAQPEEVRDYISGLPAAWDDTKLLCGYPGKYAAIARKKGDRWWISVINGTDEPLPDLRVDFSRIIPEGKGVDGIMFEDSDDKELGEWKINRIAELPNSITLQPRGGMTCVLSIKQ